MSNSTEPIQLSERLYLFRDTCNAYVIATGKRALVIDCGAADYTRRLSGLGVDKVERLLFTHHHRDMSQGADYFIERDAEVLVPQHERFLFDNAEQYMRHRWVYDSYNDRNTVNTRITNLEVSDVLRDYETLNWRGRDFEIIPTPGHTAGSVTLLAEIDGRNVAFTGDLLREEGRFHTLYDLEYSYGGCEGADLAAYSALRLLRRDIDLICPAHGEIIDEPQEALSNLIENAQAWYRWNTGAMDLPCMQEPSQITPHLIGFPMACCAWYALVGDDGRALFIDHGTPDAMHFYMNTAHREWWETVRYVRNGIDYLQDEHGLETIEAVIPTHYHDDHTAGIPYLQQHYGTEVWCAEEMKDILENPADYGEMCLPPTPVEVDRTFEHGERFDWNGFQLQHWHFPGQTEYHGLLLLAVDGRNVLFTGDSLDRNPAGNGVRSPVVFRNFHRFRSHAECQEIVVRLRPDLVAPGHGEPWEPLADEFLTYRRHTQQLQTLFRRFLPADQQWEGLNPFWLRIVPYQIEVGRGKKRRLWVRVTNLGNEPISAEIEMVGPKQVSFEPDSRHIKVRPDKPRQTRFTMKISQRYEGLPRVAIAADITIDGKRLGQMAEAFVEIEQ